MEQQKKPNPVLSPSTWLAAALSNAGQATMGPTFASTEIPANAIGQNLDQSYILANAGSEGLLGSTILPAAGIAAGAYTGAQQLSGAQNALNNKPMSFTEQAALALPTFGASLVYNPIRSAFGSGKDKDQRGRDQVRGNLQGTGFVNGDYQLPVSNGNPFNLGAEKLANGNYSYNVNFNTGDSARDAQTAETVGLIDPLSEVLSGGDSKKRSDLSGMFYNAVMSGGNRNTNIADLYRRGEQTMGLNPQVFRDQLKGLFNQGLISEDRQAGLLNSFERVFNATR